jgi:hypothetical protein
MVNWSKRVRETGRAAPASSAGAAPGGSSRIPRVSCWQQFEAVPHLTLHKLKDLLAARRIAVSHDIVAFPQGRSFKNP